MSTQIKTKTSGKAITMADLLAKSKSSIKNLSLGQKVRGTVIQKLDKSLLLSFISKGLSIERISKFKGNSLIL